MTKLWTVARSKKGFQAPLKNHVSSILADIAKASGKKRDAALAQWAELKRFLAESDEIRNGMAELPTSLRPVRNMAGAIIPDHYVLEVGALRGYYQVEESSRSCLPKLFRANTDKIFEDLAILMLAPEDWGSANRMTFSAKQKYSAILIVAIVLSAAGIGYAIYAKNKDDGGRGGALAVALAFAVLFVSRGYGTKVYEILTVEGPEILKRIEDSQAAVPGVASAVAAPEKTPAETKIDALLAKERADADDQRIQNIFLACTSVIGTLAWGFGDLIAKRFI